MRQRVEKFLLAGICLLFGFGCHAETDTVQQSADAFVLRGFGTLGYAKSNSDSAEYFRDISQPRGLTSRWSSTVDSLIGFQANLKIAQETEGVVQAISRYRFDGSYDPEISWAFLRHNFSPDLEVRAGRMGPEFYVLADSRLVGYSNITVRPPPEYFGNNVWNYFNGIDSTFTQALGKGLVRAKVFAGYAQETLPQYSLTLGTPLTYSLKGSRMAGGYLDYSQHAWQFRASHARVRFANEEPWSDVLGFDILALQPELSIKDTLTTFNSLGVVYDKGPLQVTAMANRINNQAKFLENSHSEMVLASFRIQQLTPYVGYSQVKSHVKSFTPTGDPLLDMAVSSLGAITHMDQHTVTVGARWDFHKNLDLKVQLDAIRGRPESKWLFAGWNSQWNGRMNVVSVALDFAF